MGVLGWIAFSLVLLMAIGIGIPAVANGVMSGAQKVAQYPAVAQAAGAAQAWILSLIQGTLAH